MTTSAPPVSFITFHLVTLGSDGGPKAPSSGPQSHLDRYRPSQRPRGGLPGVLCGQHPPLHGVRHPDPLRTSGRTTLQSVLYKWRISRSWTNPHPRDTTSVVAGLAALHVSLFNDNKNQNNGFVCKGVCRV